MWPLFETITDLKAGEKTLRLRRYGVIEIVDQHLLGVHLRPWPKMVSLAEVYWLGRRHHRHRSGNRCLLYYNQPWRHQNFLALKYIVSSRDGTFASSRGALTVLEEIARIKKSDAVLCEVTNHHISERLLHRWGWQRHMPQSSRRHFIKRFYGTYNDPTSAWSLSACSS